MKKPKMKKKTKKRIKLYSLIQDNGIKSKKYRIRKKYNFMPMGWYEQ